MSARFILLFLGLLLPAWADRYPLDPRGERHIAIGRPDDLDVFKTFVEAEGSFSPGFASCGISFWVFDRDTSRLHAATLDDAETRHGLPPGGALIPWTAWRAGDCEVRSEVCQITLPSPKGDVPVVGSRVQLKNRAAKKKRLALYANVHASGPAGAPIYNLNAADGVIQISGQPVLISETKPSTVEVPAPGLPGRWFDPKRMPGGVTADDPSGDLCGSLRFDFELEPGEERTLSFISPVLHGRRAVGHDWDGISKWAQLDNSNPETGAGGTDVPSPGVDFYRGLRVAELFAQSEENWRTFFGPMRVELPDARWNDALHATAAHVAMAMNDGAPDVAVINYNVFNRDGVYVANILQKTGQRALAERAIEYFLAHPFNGRAEPEADNPGQILWLLGEHWRFTRDARWLEQKLPAAQQLAALIEYYRTTPEPHWVDQHSLEFGDKLPDDRRWKLVPGSCDGHHPEYTEAFDIAGLRAAAELCAAAGRSNDAEKWRTLAAKLTESYREKFAADFSKHEYAHYCALWPCRLFPLADAAYFRALGPQAAKSWRYFPLARAHQSLLAGNRSAASATLENHLTLPQMHGWFALDEGGPSGPGNWTRARTKWPVKPNGPGGVFTAPAMPHGWASAEFHLLMRDALVFEDGDRLIVFAGVDEKWFEQPMRLHAMPTHFGPLTLDWSPAADGKATLTFSGANPPGGVLLRAPNRDIVVEKSGAEISWRD